jgi:4a-hydroxytetrahydrobiopterin dehydratase
MSALADKQCGACKSGEAPMSPDGFSAFTRQLDAGWAIQENHYLEREFRFPDFKSALRFTNAVGYLAEEQGHHPDIILGWGVVKLKLWTHSVNGLTENDFVMAAKIDRLDRG